MNHYYTGRTVKYFTKYYIGRRYDEYEKTVMGFATPYENGAAFEKRKSTVDEWSKGYYFNPQTQTYPAIVTDNFPSEFSVIGMIRRSSRTNNVVWRISTQYQCDLEISSENLEYIIERVGLGQGGRIQARCVLGRILSQNHLIPEGTELWNTFIAPSLNYIGV
jgi:hypothetical protein